MAARILSADWVQRKGFWIVVDRLDVGSDRPFQLFSGPVDAAADLLFIGLEWPRALDKWLRACPVSLLNEAKGFNP